MTPSLRDSLAQVVALLDRATPGVATMRIRTRDDSIYVSIGEAARGPHTQGDVHLPEDDVFAMVHAVNFLREHGPALLAVVEGREDG